MALGESRRLSSRITSGARALASATFLHQRYARDHVLVQGSSLVPALLVAGPNLIAQDAAGLLVAGPNFVAQDAPGLFVAGPNLVAQGAAGLLVAAANARLHCRKRNADLFAHLS